MCSLNNCKILSLLHVLKQCLWVTIQGHLAEPFKLWEKIVVSCSIVLRLMENIWVYWNKKLRSLHEIHLVGLICKDICSSSDTVQLLQLILTVWCHPWSAEGFNFFTSQFYRTLLIWCRQMSCTHPGYQERGRAWERKETGPLLDSHISPLCFPQFCSFKKWPFTSCGWHGLGQDCSGNLHRCLLPKGMALAGGDSLFCEVHVGRGTVSFWSCGWPVEGMCDGYSVLTIRTSYFIFFILNICSLRWRR